MPIRPPALDDRSFDDLVADLVRRIPAHTPEWTSPREGDPGRTLIDLFAWLGDTILYRANLIPERQRLAFLRLLGAGMRPATPAWGVVQVSIDDQAVTAPTTLPLYSLIATPQPFETTGEVTVFAVDGPCYIKRKTTDAEAKHLRSLLPDLKDLYGVQGDPVGYVTTPVFAGGAAEPAGRDIVADTLDGCLWFALLAPKPLAASVDDALSALGGVGANRRQLLSIGVSPALAPSSDFASSFTDVGVRARIPHIWEVSCSQGDGTVYLPLDVLSDTSVGLTQPGVVRLLLPGKDDMGAPTNDVLQQVAAGVGDRPPRIDDPTVAARLVCWVRLRPDPTANVTSLSLAWAGINAVGIEQRQSLGRQTIGQGTGASGLQLPLGADSVDPVTLAIEVEEEEGMRPWRQVPDVAAAGRDDRVYSLDPEAGLVAFGDGVRGMVPSAGATIQVASMRAGGGAAGNLPAGTLKTITAPPGAPRLKVSQPLATFGGADFEALADAEVRIPAQIRNGGRAVTSADYQELALRTPGAAIGRVEVLPLFKPQQRRTDVPGVVSVMVLPARNGLDPPAPRPDRPTLETVYAWLDQRRPLATELYVIGADYVPLGISAAVELADVTQREAVLNAVSDAIRLAVWSLPPGGPDGTGWPLGRAVDDRLIETAIARVPGVLDVAPVLLFGRRTGETQWRALPPDTTGRIRLPLLSWQLPELLMLAVTDAASASPTLPPANGIVGAGGIAVPVVPETC